MKKKTLVALGQSIQKWQDIVNGKEHSRGKLNCPLCELFNTSSWCSPPNVCVGCPVKEHTGKKYCEDTPYETFESSDDSINYKVDKWGYATFKLVDGKEVKQLNKNGKENAKKELEFLISLLPKE